jgi:hypothetical protein
VTTRVRAGSLDASPPGAPVSGVEFVARAPALAAALAALGQSAVVNGTWPPSPADVVGVSRHAAGLKGGRFRCWHRS